MKTLQKIAVTSSFVVPLQGALIFGGDFEIFKPGTNYTVAATFAPGASARGLGDGIELAGLATTLRRSRNRS